MDRVKRWLLFKLIRHYFKGITPEDFADISKLSENQVENYCLAAGEIWNNETFQTEMLRLQYKQEQYLALSAQSPADLIFGRAVLYTIKEVMDRFKLLGSKGDLTREESRSEVVE